MPIRQKHLKGKHMSKAARHDVCEGLNELIILAVDFITSIANEVIELSLASAASETISMGILRYIIFQPQCRAFHRQLYTIFATYLPNRTMFILFDAFVNTVIAFYEALAKRHPREEAFKTLLGALHTFKKAAHELPDESLSGVERKRFVRERRKRVFETGVAVQKGYDGVGWYLKSISFSAKAMGVVEALRDMGQAMKENTRKIISEFRESEKRVGQGVAQAVEKIDRIQPLVQVGVERIERIAKDVGQIKGRVIRRNRFSNEVKSTCFNYWISGRKLPAVKRSVRTKVTHEAVFNYYSTELRAIGIETAKDFDEALGAWSDYLGREVSRKRENPPRESAAKPRIHRK